jgi:hypothetical protein
MLTTVQINSLTTSQVQALTTSQTANVFGISPLVLDLTGVAALSTANVAGLAPQALSVLTSTAQSSGVQTVGLSQAGVQFDLGNTGATNASVGWITPGEGFLVNLPKGATTISNGSELFGTATVLPNGQTAPDGFAALSAFDQNGNGVIDANDAIFNQLQVWVDTGTNGTTPVGQLFTLAQLNIQSLNLSAKVSGQGNNGNTIGLVSSYTTTNGQTHELADVWLSSTAGSSSAVSQLSSALSHYTATGAVNAAGTGTAPLGTHATSKAALPGAGSAGSTSNANVLASALSQYNANGQLVSSAPLSQSVTAVANSTTSQLVNPSTVPTTTITKNGSSI